MPNAHPVAVRIPPAEREPLDRLAVALGCTRSLIVRAAVAEITAADLGSIRERVAALPTMRAATRGTTT